MPASLLDALGVDLVPSLDLQGVPSRFAGFRISTEKVFRMVGERRKRPAYAKPAQPRTPKGKRNGLRASRRRYHLPG